VPKTDERKKEATKGTRLGELAAATQGSLELEQREGAVPAKFLILHRTQRRDGKGKTTVARAQGLGGSGRKSRNRRTKRRRPHYSFQKAVSAKTG